MKITKKLSIINNAQGLFISEVEDKYSKTLVIMKFF